VTAPALAPALPFEYRADRPVPDTLELCARCLRGVLHRRTPESPYCPTCGAESPGIRFTREGTA